MNTRKFSMRELVIIIGGNHESVDQRLRRVARAAGLHPRLVRGAWDRDPNISIETARKLKAAAEKKQNEARNTAARLESIAARLETIDPEFHRDQVDFIRDLATRHRNLAAGDE
jgi:hypothetical protein